MLEILFVVLAAAGAIVASITDLKSRIIPNKLSFGLLTIGVLGNAGYGLYTGDISLIRDLAVGLASIFVVGYIFWKLGGWGAGDAKEFLFLASLVPRYPGFLRAYLNPQLANYPFPLTMLVNTLLLVFPVVVIYSIALSYKQLSLAEFVGPLKNYRRYAKDSLFFVAAASFGLTLGRPYLSIIVLVAFYSSLLRSSSQYILAFLLLLFTVDGDVNRLSNLARYLIATTVFFGILGLFWNALGLLRGKALKETKRISDLLEGNIIAEEIYIQDGEVRRDARSMLEKFKALVLKEEERRAWKKREIIAYPTAAGLTGEEISVLKKYVGEGKLEDAIVVKKNMPFGLVVPFGLFSSLLIGDLVTVLR